jgi:DNA-binding Lrp family transcriptional regulator
VRKLEAAGVITGYRCTVNLQALGYNIRAIVRVGRAEYMRIVTIVLNVEREYQAMLPPKREAGRPTGRKRKT